MTDIDIDASDLDRLRLDLLWRTPMGRDLLTRAHQAMGEVTAERIKRYAPEDRTPPRSRASLEYGPLSENVTVEAFEDEVLVHSPFYARFQDDAAYVWAAVNDSLPDARRAFTDVIQRHVNRPGSGFLGHAGGLGAQAGRTALALAVGAALYYKGYYTGQAAVIVAKQGGAAAIRSGVLLSAGGPIGAVLAATTGVRDIRSIRAGLRTVLPRADRRGRLSAAERAARREMWRSMTLRERLTPASIHAHGWTRRGVTTAVRSGAWRVHQQTLSLVPPEALAAAGGPGSLAPVTALYGRRAGASATVRRARSAGRRVVEAVGRPYRRGLE